VRTVSDAQLFKALESKVTVKAWDAATGILQLNVAGSGLGTVENLRQLAHALMAGGDNPCRLTA
jgi:hypothetical protein